MTFLESIFGNNSLVEQTHPLDLLYQNNPEIGSLVYAKREGLLDPEMMQYMAGIRCLQHEEQIALMGEITNRLGLKYDKEKLEKIVNGNIEMTNVSETNETKRTQISEEGYTKRIAIEETALARRSENHEANLTQRVMGSETGMTDRTRLETDSYRDIMKTKYEMQRKMAELYTKGQIHMSDNEYKATVKEAEAYRDMVIFTEQAKKGALVQLSKDELTARLKEEETKIAIKFKEAETLRYMKHSDNKRDVINNYVIQQCRILEAMIFYDTEQLRNDTEKKKSADSQINYAVDKLTKVLIERDDTNEVYIEGGNELSKINLKVGRK